MNFTLDGKVLIQGITEPLGAIYAAKMKDYGTNVVAGVSPGYGGQTVYDIPVFDLVEPALSAVGAIDTTIIFVSPYLALDAAKEAIAAGIRQIILISGGIPPLDMVHLLRIAEQTQTTVLGPNSLGIIVPGKWLLGTHPEEFYTPGAVGLIGCSGSLTSEIALELTQAGFGQSIGVCIGSDSIVGSSLPQWLQILDKDKNTKAVVLVGEVGDRNEQTLAQYILEKMAKPVVAYIAGRHMPEFKHQHYLSDFIPSQPDLKTDVDKKGRKITAFEQKKIPVAQRPSQIPDLLKKALKK
ncbi:MAG TPA: CoA-binding protein [Cyanobacteria bacterium UBA11372]|nr:CoA-binding protein [Cyanobacteria bacterium UBA11372]